MPIAPEKVHLQKCMLVFFFSCLFFFRGNTQSITMGSYPYTYYAYDEFDTQSQLTAGEYTGFTAHLYLSPKAWNDTLDLKAGWYMTVQASGNFTCDRSSASLDLKYVTISFDPTEGTTTSLASTFGSVGSPVTLTQSEQVVLKSNGDIKCPPNYNAETCYKIFIKGGQQLYLLDNGIYTTNLIFRLYDASGNLKATNSGSSTGLSFNKFYYGAIPNPSSVTLSSAAQNVTLNFTKLSDYTNGVSTSLASGLVVVSTTAYEVTVRASGDLTNSSYASTIPVSSVYLQSLNGPSYVTQSSFALSSSDQVLLYCSNAPSSTTNTFDLKYFTKAGDQNFYSATTKGITYTTNLVFTVDPL